MHTYTCTDIIFSLFNRITCLCNIYIYPLKPHFYIEKLGFARVYLFFFLFLLQNKDCGYSLELLHRGGSNVYQQSMFLAKIRKISKISTENFHFLELKNLCLLHGRVFVMFYFYNFFSCNFIACGFFL